MTTPIKVAKPNDAEIIKLLQMIHEISDDALAGEIKNQCDEDREDVGAEFVPLDEQLLALVQFAKAIVEQHADKGKQEPWQYDVALAPVESGYSGDLLIRRADEKNGDPPFHLSFLSVLQDNEFVVKKGDVYALTVEGAEELLDLLTGYYKNIEPYKKLPVLRTSFTDVANAFASGMTV